MTVIFKDYKAANNDERAFYLLYLDGVREGIIELNVVLEEKRQQPLFCLPEKLVLTIEQAEDIVMRQAEKITDPDRTSSGSFAIFAAILRALSRVSNVRPSDGCRETCLID
jgi:hypothetical protein